MFLDLLFPNRCLGCNLIIENQKLVCDFCLQKINFTHWQWGKENPLKTKIQLFFPVENAFALFHFERDSLPRKIIHQLKYRNQEKIGEILANWVAERLDFNENKPDIMVSVPLHSKKLKERGYNQLHIFAEALSQHFQIPVNHGLVKRNSYNKAQAGQDKHQRLQTQYDFSLTEPIENCHLLLIDDVFTTGNTMSTMAWEILKSGNNRVSILVMAIDG